ncbi:MAG: hypothetical protein WCF65_06805 [Parachlamydiaceae bacterium]
MSFSFSSAINWLRPASVAGLLDREKMDSWAQQGLKPHPLDPLTRALLTKSQNPSSNSNTHAVTYLEPEIVVNPISVPDVIDVTDPVVSPGTNPQQKVDAKVDTAWSFLDTALKTQLKGLPFLIPLFLIGLCTRKTEKVLRTINLTIRASQNPKIYRVSLENHQRVGPMLALHVAAGDEVRLIDEAQGKSLSQGPAQPLFKYSKLHTLLNIAIEGTDRLGIPGATTIYPINFSGLQMHVNIIAGSMDDCLNKLQKQKVRVIKPESEWTSVETRFVSLPDGLSAGEKHQLPFKFDDGEVSLNVDCV